MRIVLVISSLGAGGAERVIISLANHLARRGCDVVLITFEPPGIRPYYAVDPRVTLQQLNLVACEPALQGIRQSLRRILTLRRWLKHIGPDVVVSFLAKINVITLLATRGLDVSVVVSERNNPEQNLASFVWRWLRKRLYGVADRIVAPSQGVLNALPPAIRTRSCVIPNPVDCSSAQEHHDRGRTVVAVGRLEEQKGFDLLLTAFARIADRYPDWRLVIWGDGSIRHEIEDLRAELGLAHRVEMPGVTLHPGEWAKDADIFVLSSRYEGFVNVVLEAMAAGLPVLSTDCRWSPREIIRHEVDGMLVPSENVVALAAGLEKLMSDSALRARLGEAARRNVQRFAPEHVMAMWDEFLREVTRRAVEPSAVGSLSPSSGHVVSAMSMPSRYGGLVAKRAFDIAASLAGLVVTAPVLLATALVVRFGLGTPVLFRQQRPGLGGHPFMLLKFRTMTDARDETGELLPDAARLTRLGKLLRRSSLDELPELINVLRGDMSLVGPRPLLMEYLPHYTPEHARRHEVRPGLTGWAAINGRNATTWPDRLDQDVWYVDHRCFALDCKILLLTVGKVLRQEGISQEGQATMTRFDEEFGTKV